MLRVPNKVIFQASSDYFWMLHSIEMIWQNNRISESEFKLIIKLLKTIIRKLNKIARDKSKNRSPYFTFELNFIREYIETNFGERITIQKIKDELKIKNPDVTPPST